MRSIAEIETAVGQTLPEGFRRRGRTWRRGADDVIQVVNLQVEQRGEQLFMNIGFFLRTLDPEMGTPREEQCHVRVRGDRLFRPRSEFNLHAVLAPHYDQLDGEERRRLLEAFMREDLGPILSTGTTTEGLARLLEEDVIPPARVVAGARGLLGIAAPTETDGYGASKALRHEGPGGEMGRFAARRWSRGDWCEQQELDEPWLTIDIHDSDVTTIVFAPAPGEAGGRFHLGTHPAVYFDLPRTGLVEDPDAEASAFAQWAQLATDTDVAAEEVRALMATVEDEGDPLDVFVEDTLARLLVLAGIDVPREEDVD